MSNKEVIEKLKETRKNHNEDCLFCAVKDTAIDQALTLLEKHPEPTEFTKSKRNWIKMNSFLKDFRDVVVELAKGNLDACDIIDRQARELKEVKDALNKKFDEVCQNILDVLYPKLQAENKRLEEALKAKKEPYDPHDIKFQGMEY